MKKAFGIIQCGILFLSQEIIMDSQWVSTFLDSLKRSGGHKVSIVASKLCIVSREVQVLTSIQSCYFNRSDEYFINNIIF